MRKDIDLVRFLKNDGGARFVVALFIVSAGFLAIQTRTPTAVTPRLATTASSAAVPVVMHTDGGRLEVAVIRAREALMLEAPMKTFIGINLGRTVSHVQLDATYVFYVQMEKEWPIVLEGETATVFTKALRPQLPVAFDSRSIRRDTHSGWARFDKEENLKALEYAITPELQKRAYGYVPLATTEARRTISDFVRTWLARHWDGGKQYRVNVVFAVDPAGEKSDN